MTPEQQRIAIAEACGWKLHSELDATWCSPHQSDCPLVADLIPLPDYLNDLNAMHEAKKVLTDDQRFAMSCLLKDLVGKGKFWACCESECWSLIAYATAAQRAEAFLRTLNLWKD